MTTPNHNLRGVAWLASGRLFVQSQGQVSREIESTFGRETLERRQRSQQLHGWKNRSGVWGQMGMAPPAMSQWEDALPPPRPIRFCALARGQKADELLYALDCGEVGGLFQFDLASGYEMRLMHREGFITGDLSRHPTSGEVAVSLRRADRTMGLTIGENGGNFLQDVTFSDGIDEAPAWLLDGSRRIVFHSAAWMRDPHGRARAMTTFRIDLLDLDSKSITTVLEDDAHDLLQPRLLADGTLLFVRRPYGKQYLRRSVWEDAKAVLLIPWHLLQAIFGFLNFFSMMFAGKPLTTAGGPPQRDQDFNPVMTLWGHMIDTRKLMKANQDATGMPLVPKDWQLIRRTADGTETLLAENVLSYDVLPSGDIVYTDGGSVRHLAPSGTQTTLAKGCFIERVLAMTDCGSDAVEPENATPMARP